MGTDDDTDCPEHDWRFETVRVTAQGAQGEYQCRTCGAVMLADMRDAPWDSGSSA